MFLYSTLIILGFSLFETVQSQRWWKSDIQNGHNPWIRSGAPASVSDKASASDKASPCVCVKPYQCDPKSGQVITTGEGIVGWRSSFSCKDDLVCCIPPDSASVEEINTDGIEQEFSASTVDETTEPSSNVPLVCGKRYEEEEDGAILKVSGTHDETETVLGDFPWMLLMTYEDESGQKQIIGGASLIHPYAALTAAHNVQNKETYKLEVRGGEWDLGDDEAITPQNRRVKNIILHPKYVIKPIKYDIAIIIMEEPFAITPAVGLICLPPPNSKIQWNTCYATGWGAKGHDGDFTGDQTLRKAKMSIVPRDICQDILRNNRLGADFKLHKSFICAGSSTDADTCKGDGGGPLACQSRDSPLFNLVGITSWGIGCAKKGVPGAYTNVVTFVDWIHSTLQSENISPLL